MKNWMTILSSCVFVASFAGAAPKSAISKPPKKVEKRNMVTVKMETSEGTIKLELDKEKAPVTVDNFVSYVEDGYYNGTIFHRVIKEFMIQGGGFDESSKQKKTKKPIKNEGKNGLKNERGTIAMARTMDPDSATAQFFINHRDNSSSLDAGAHPRSPDGYAVFGKVTEGMDVVDKIAGVKTHVSAEGDTAGHPDVPVKKVVIQSVTIEK